MATFKEHFSSGSDKCFCSFCGAHMPAFGGVHPATPFNEELHTCRRCAVEVLPGLIADSLNGFEMTRSQATHVFRTVEKGFWIRVGARIYGKGAI